MPVPDVGEPLPDKAALDAVRDIVQLLGHAASAVKIYPSDHANVRKFVDDLAGKMKDFLEKNLELEIGIEEFQFTFSGIRVYEDLQPMKSLPFFFFKDGMQSLIFDRGLEGEELKAFFDVIKAVAKLPAEEGDIVNALWEKDFANIRYVAPDEFLESKIFSGGKSLESHLLVNRGEFSSGRVDLLPEDLQEMEVVKSRLRDMNGQAALSGVLEGTEKQEPDTPSSLLTDNELGDLDAIVQANRKISAEEEFVNVVFEIVYLEDRVDAFPGLLETLKQGHQELIRRRNFSKALGLINQAVELKEIFLRSGSPKAEILSLFLAYAVSDQALTEVKEAYLEAKEAASPQDFLDYTTALSPASWKILAELFEAGPGPDLRFGILALFQEAGRNNVRELIPLALDSRPQLSREIINIISLSEDQRKVSHLAAFLRSVRKSLRLETVKALAGLDEAAAQSLLVKLLGDEDEELRIEAASGLKPRNDPEAVGHLLRLVEAKGFKNKTMKEKQALLGCLGRSGAPEACRFLRQVIGKRTITFDRRNLETRLAAVSALGQMASEEAVKCLKEGAGSRNKKIKEACLTALLAVSEKREGPNSPGGKRS